MLEAFADETIAVNLATGRYYSLDLIGAETLELLATGHDVGPSPSTWPLRYDADRAEVEAAVAGSRSSPRRRRAAPRGAGPRARRRPPARPLALPCRFSAPTLSVYSDMEDLLLLDPIHDVDETGWPVRADATDPEPAGPPASE